MCKNVLRVCEIYITLAYGVWKMRNVQNYSSMKCFNLWEEWKLRQKYPRI